MDFTMRVPTGTRFGIWNHQPHMGPPDEKWKRAFHPLGFYMGPELLGPDGKDPIIGTQFCQKLMEGDLKFRIGFLFRPDRGVRQRLEAIIMLETFFPEMFEYTDWVKCDDTLKLSPPV